MTYGRLSFINCCAIGPKTDNLAGRSDGNRLDNQTALKGGFVSRR